VKSTALVICVVVCAVAVVDRADAQNGRSDEIAAGYALIYGGDPEQATRHFEALHARDPRNLPAWFGLLFAQHARIELDDSLAPAFEKGIIAFLDEADARHTRSPDDAEATFYLAQAYLLRSTYRINYDKGVWGAARDAAKSKGFSDEYIKSHPNHGDAYLSLGLYNYYVDIAPNFVKVLRVLLLLPSGNRAEGLKQLERANHEGSMFAPLAEGALADIYGSLEGRLAEAIQIGERYVQRFPGNADIRLELAQLYAHPTVEAYDRAEQQYAAVVKAATTSSLRHVANRYRAVLGLSSLRRSEWRLDEAIALATNIIDQKIEKPSWLYPSALLRRANYRMLLNDTSAIDDARQVLRDAKMKDWHKAAHQQIAAIEARRRTDEGAIYTALIPGNRLIVQHRWDEAKAAYDRVGASKPGDWQVRYRLAYLEFARGNYTAAATAFDAIATSPARMPDWLKAAAIVNLAWTHDMAGRRAEALKLYKRVVDNYENEAPSSAARLGLIAPYRGPISIS
jgi:tetratricopeptide (TPR) repeat protein